MAWPNGQQRVVALTIQSSQVDALVSDFPVLVVQATLPSEAYTSADPDSPQSDGGDIRFASDIDGNAQLPFEVVAFALDGDSASIEIHVQIPSVSAVADTTFYMAYKTAGTTSLPAADAANGSQNVWDGNFVLVSHMHEDPGGSAPQMLDSTANGLHLTAFGGMNAADSVAGAVAGNAVDFDGTDDRLERSDEAVTSIAGALTAEAVIEADSTSTGGVTEGVVSKYVGAGNQRGYLLGYNNQIMRFTLSPNGTTFTAAATGAVITTPGSHYVGAAYNPSVEMDIRVDGADEATVTASVPAAIFDNTAPLWLGTNFDSADANRYFDGTIDEVRLSNTNRSDAWRDATYRSLLTPASFVVEGVPEDVGQPVDSDHAFRVGSKAAAAADLAAPFDSVAGLTSDAGGAVEWLAGIVADGAADVEAVASLARDAGFLASSLAGLSADLAARVEALAGIAADTVAPAEWGGAVLVSSDALLPLDWRAAVAADRVLPLDSRAVVVADSGVPAAWRAGVQVDRAAVASWLPAIAADADVPVEWRTITVINADALAPVEWRSETPVVAPADVLIVGADDWVSVVPAGVYLNTK